MKEKAPRRQKKSDPSLTENPVPITPRERALEENARQIQDIEEEIARLDENMGARISEMEAEINAQKRKPKKTKRKPKETEKKPQPKNLTEETAEKTPDDIVREIEASIDESPAETTPTKEATPEEEKIKYFDTKFIEEQIRTILLGSNLGIKIIEGPNVTGEGNEITLNIKINKMADIGINLTLGNNNNGIYIKSYNIDANRMIKGKVNSLLKPHLDNLPNLLKIKLEEITGKKWDLISIENGQLKVELTEKTLATPEEPAQEEVLEEPTPEEEVNQDSTTQEEVVEKLSPTPWEKFKSIFRRKEKIIPDDGEPVSDAKIKLEETKEYIEFRAQKIAEFRANNDMDGLITFLEEESRKQTREMGEGKIRRLLSKGIEQWDNWGEKEEGWKGITKRMTKRAASLFMIGAATVASVDRIGNVATALQAGANTYLGKKLSIGIGFAGLMEWSRKLSPEKRRMFMWAMTGGSAVLALTGGNAVGGTLVGATAFGYGVSSLTKRYSKKIEARKQALREKISFETIEAEALTVQKEMQKLLRREDWTRIFGKLAEGAVALGSSIAILEAPSALNNLLGNESAPEPTTRIPEPEKVEIPHATISDSTETQATASDTTKIFTPEPTDSTLVEPVVEDSTKINVEPPTTTTPDSTSTQQVTPDTTIEPNTPPASVGVNEDAIVGKGEGIEHALRRQIENSPDILKALEYDGELGDKDAIRQFSGRMAHVLAINNGYVDPSGNEVWVAEGDKVAYEIRLDGDKLLIDEKTVGGELLETSTPGEGFEAKEGAKVDSHEMVHNEAQSRIEALEKEIIQKIDGTYNEEASGAFTEETGLDKNVFGTPQNTENTGVEKADTQNGESSGVVNLNENPLGLPQDILLKVNEIVEKSIDKVFEGDRSMYREVKVETAELVRMDTETINDAGRPFITYLKELVRVSGLHPIEGTAMIRAETIREFITRVLQTEASRGNLITIESIDKDLITHVIKNKL